MAGARSSCAGFLSSVGCKVRCPIHKSFYEYMLGARHWRHGAFYVSRQQRLCRRLPSSLCTAAPLLKKIDFPIFLRGGAAVHRLITKAHFKYYSWRLIVFIHRLRNNVTIGKSRTISNANDTQARQVATNPRRGRFSTEILWSENADFKFSVNNEEDGTNKQRNRKNITKLNITQWISNAKVILRANWSDFG